jgi:hypothetical protein
MPFLSSIFMVLESKCGFFNPLLEMTLNDDEEEIIFTLFTGFSLQAQERLSTTINSSFSVLINNQHTYEKSTAYLSACDAVFIRKCTILTSQRFS